MRWLLILTALASAGAACAASGPDGFGALPQGAVSSLDQARIEERDERLAVPNIGVFRITRRVRHANGDVTVHAFDPTRAGQALVTRGKSGAFGTFRNGDRVRLLTTDRTGAWTIRLPVSGVSWNRCATPDAARPLARQAGMVRSNQTAAVAGAVPGTVIDLLVIYNQAMAARYPGDLIETRINHLLASTNQAMANSHLDLGIRLVGIGFFDYRNDNTNSDAADDIARALAGENRPGLNGLAALRDQLGADLISLFRPHDIESRGSCGIAFYPDNAPALGVNVNSDGMSSWSICTDDVITHEIGHNLGAAHQTGSGGGTFDARGAAFVREGRFTTLMASFGTGRADRFRGLNLFSNPQVQCGGEPCGSAIDADNAAVIRSTMAEVASYRTASSPLPLPETLPRAEEDTDGDLVTDWLDAFPFDALEQVDTDGDGTGDGADQFPRNAKQQFDTDGDGQGDARDDDDDGDGTPDLVDAFPLLAAEQADSDGDGVGDGADAFPFDRFEHRDTDGDGTGDHADTDADNDGFADLDSSTQDLLVVSAGNSRILRFNAHTGIPRGVEMAPWQGLVTFQSDMAWRRNDDTLLLLADSAVQRQSLLDRDPLGTWVPAYDDRDPSFADLDSGFPTAVTTLAPGVQVAVARMGLPDIAFFRGQFLARDDFALQWRVAQDEQHVAMLGTDSGAFILGSATRTVYAANAFQTLALAGPDAAYLRNPRRLALTEDGRLLVSDRQREVVVALDGATGDYLGDLADVRGNGYRGTDGIAVLDDGTLLVSASRDHAILAFDGSTGAFLGERVNPRAGGLEEPRSLLVVPALGDRYPRDNRRVMRPNAGLWSDSSSNGRGFDIQVFGHLLTAIWYSYAEDGSPIWYLATGELNGFDFSAPLLEFRRDQAGTTSATPVGTLSLAFDSERRAEANWSVGAAAGSESIEWLAFDPDVSRHDLTGLWGTADAPGWGVSLLQQGERYLAIAFVYDDAGLPRWLLSDVAQGQDHLVFDMAAFFSESLCPGCVGPANLESRSAGQISIERGEATRWSSQVDFPAPLTGRWVLDSVPIIRFSETPALPR